MELLTIDLSDVGRFNAIDIFSIAWSPKTPQTCHTSAGCDENLPLTQKPTIDLPTSDIDMYDVGRFDPARIVWIHLGDVGRFSPVPIWQVARSEVAHPPIDKRYHHADDGQDSQDYFKALSGF